MLNVLLTKYTHNCGPPGLAGSRPRRWHTHEVYPQQNPNTIHCRACLDCGGNMPKPPYRKKKETSNPASLGLLAREDIESTFSLENVPSSNRSDLNVG
jgi:hypothetical protein